MLKQFKRTSPHGDKSSRVDPILERIHNPKKQAGWHKTFSYEQWLKNIGSTSFHHKFVSSWSVLFLGIHKWMPDIQKSACLFDWRLEWSDTVSRKANLLFSIVAPFSMGISSLRTDFAPIRAKSFLHELILFGRASLSREASKKVKIFPICQNGQQAWRWSNGQEFVNMSNFVWGGRVWVGIYT